MRFSRRLPALSTNRLTELCAALRSRPDAEPICDLTSSNPTTTLPGLYGASLLAPLARPEALVYAPTPRGDRVARDAIACYYQRRGLTVDPDQLTLSASTSEAYSWLFQLLCDPGQRVLFPQPSYPLLSSLAELTSVHVDRYPLWFDPTAGRFRIDTAALAAAVSDEASAATPTPCWPSPTRPTSWSRAM